VANICSSILNHRTVITKLSYKQFRFPVKFGLTWNFC